MKKSPLLSKKPARPPISDDEAHDSRELLTHAPLGSTLDFLRHLWAVHHGIQSMSKRMEARHGVTGPQRMVIRIIGRFPGIGAGDIARIVHFHPSTLTGILSRLEAHNFITREAHAHDRRRMLLHLTARGRVIEKTTAGTVESAAETSLRGFKRNEIAAAAAVLHAFAYALSVED